MNTPSSFENFLNNELNPQQKEAVLHTEGPVLVIAGAGSGKTRVITARITNLLLQQQVHPAQIVALTFTNKAATEMRERIVEFLDGQSRMPFIGTFHSYCLYLLRLHSDRLPFNPFSILDEDDKHSLLNKILKTSSFYKKITAQQLSYTISKIKNNSGADDLSYQEIQMQELVNAYEKEKKASNCFDFDDLLLEATKLLKNPDVREIHQHRVRHIMVDEYQDTNVIQHELLKLMAAQNEKSCVIDSLCAVGDEDQSIYSWRGATVENISHFKNDFKNTKLIKIEQNYRSKQPILEVANHVIQHNTNRNEKKLWSERTGSDCVRSIQCLSGYQEAELIARYCKLLHSNNSLQSTAIFYRTHYQSRIIEEALLKQGIPYMIIGGIRFYERKEIKDLIAFLRLIVNPFDRIAFSRIINCPTRGLGDKFQEEFLEHWNTNSLLNVTQLAEFLLKEKQIIGSKALSLQAFLAIFSDITSTSSAVQALTIIMARSNYLNYLKESYEKEEAREREENIKEFLGAAQFFAGQGKASIEALLEEISLLMDKPNEEKTTENKVKLMTIHAAKGLEFNNVIIAGMEENIFPSSRSLVTNEGLEEERRLFYVAITRAKNRLVITCARYRQTYGKMETQLSSRFLDEVPTKHCKSEQAGNWQIYEMQNYFSQWLGFTPQTPELFTFSKPSKPTPSLSPTSTSASPLQTSSTLAQRIEADPFDDFEIEPEISHAESIKRPISKPKPVESAVDITKPKNKKNNCPFKKHQTVQHNTFGIGIVQDIEEKNSKFFITAQFKIGVKKIDSSFLTT